MKKTYQHPSVRLFAISAQQLMAGSPLNNVTVGDDYDGSMPIEGREYDLDFEE